MLIQQKCSVPCLRYVFIFCLFHKCIFFFINGILITLICLVCTMLTSHIGILCLFSCGSSSVSLSANTSQYQQLGSQLRINKVCANYKLKTASQECKQPVIKFVLVFRINCFHTVVALRAQKKCVCYRQVIPPKNYFRF